MGVPAHLSLVTLGATNLALYGVDRMVAAFVAAPGSE